MNTQRMHPDEIDVDLNLVRALITTQFPHWAHLPIRPVPSSGTDNAMYRLGEHMVVRVPRIYWAVDAIDHEQQWLPQLAPLLPLSIPVPLAKGEPTERYPYPWSVYQWLDGHNPIVDQFEEPVQLAKELAHFIRVLQGVTLPNGPLAGRGGPLTTRHQAVQSSLEQVEGLIDRLLVSTIWEATLQVPAWRGSPVWLHSDLAPGNLLLVDGHLTVGRWPSKGGD